jgi:hypothetical protein
MKKKVLFLKVVIISLCVVNSAVFIISKTNILLSSVSQARNDKIHAVNALYGVLRSETRFVTKREQEIFKKTDMLLTPIFLIPFILLAYKSVESPEKLLETE